MYSYLIIYSIKFLWFTDFRFETQKGLFSLKKDLQLFRSTAAPHVKEHFDAYLLIGYTADRHARVVDVDYGKDPACCDGLQILHAAALRWEEGSVFDGMNNNQSGGDASAGSNA